ncbi:tetraacyldisaccharide 4'-kinase [Kozakia baliensis]|uniref:tetraacyldisaccharide 4'-kinase n=1 Tax=Kozakia baliensis TaxID=153496 RepID=UPI000497E47D|nr:tetraacyldisaccharide 4'-kinase [Kozakia baliensis]
MKFGPPSFWNQVEPSWQAKALTPLSWLLQSAGHLRSYRAAPVMVDVPVLCCGNLTVGGAGKTTLVLDFAQRLQARGRHPHILSRGYGGQEKGPLRVDLARHTANDVGDEPFMLAKTAPVWIGANRGETARMACAEGADCLIMDDGLQNHTLHQTMRIITVDGATGFGNGRVMPAGPLREPAAKGLAEADGLVMIGEDRTDLLPHIPNDLLRLQARLIPGPEIRRLQGKRLIAFAGIARPDKFFDMLTEAGLPLLRCISFADHHRYNERDCRRLLALGRQEGVRLVTTAKDAVKLPERILSEVKVINVELRWSDPDAPERLLDRLWATA